MTVGGHLEGLGSGFFICPMDIKPIKRVLIANRGEIAIRVIRTCQKLGISTVAVHSDVDKDSPYVKLADVAICIGGNSSSESYLKQELIIAAAKKSGADAIHPGNSSPLQPNSHA